MQFISFFQKELQINFGAFIRKVNLPLIEQNFFGLISNIIVANGYDEIELKSFYFQQSASIATNKDLGKLLKQEFALFIIKKLYELNSNFDHLLSELTDDEYFQKYLNQLNDFEFNSYVITLTNSSKKIINNKLKDEINTAIQERYKTVISDEIKLKIEEWYKDIELSDNIRKGEDIDISNVLSYWNDKKDSWLYPSILDTLISNGYANNNEEIINDAVEIIRVTKYKGGNTYLYLANTLTYHELSKEQNETVFGCLKEEIPKWHSNQSVSFLITIYHKLSNYYNSEYYKEQISILETKKFEILHNMDLPRLAKNGNYFQILSSYFNSLKWYGLKTELGFKEYYHKLNVPTNEKILFIENWKRQGANYPAFSKYSSGNQVLNSDFLILTEYLFSKQVIEAGYENERIEINKKIKQNLSLLFRMIKDLKSLPEHFVLIFDEFINRSSIKNE